MQLILSNALREHRECMSGASFQSPWCLQACHESCQYQQNVKVQAININKARVLFMQTRYWERPLLLVSREALSWQLIICLVSIRCWGRERCQGRGIMNIIASFLILRFTHREINFPFKRINSDVAWAVSLPRGTRVFGFWRGGWVTALMSQDAALGLGLSPQICFEYFDNVVGDYGCIPDRPDTYPDIKADSWGLW